MTFNAQISGMISRRFTSWKACVSIGCSLQRPCFTPQRLPVGLPSWIRIRACPARSRASSLHQNCRPHPTPIPNTSLIILGFFFLARASAARFASQRLHTPKGTFIMQTSGSLLERRCTKPPPEGAGTANTTGTAGTVGTFHCGPASPPAALISREQLWDVPEVSAVGAAAVGALPVSPAGSGPPSHQDAAPRGAGIPPAWQRGYSEVCGVQVMAAGLLAARRSTSTAPALPVIMNHSGAVIFH